MVKRGEKLTVEVPVTNVGERDGAETVLWFISDPYSSITRPVKELKRFTRVTLKPGEKKTVSFELPISELAFWNIDMVKTVEDENGKRFLEAGEYYIMVKDRKVKIELVD